jgi:hypothetical protein
MSRWVRGFSRIGLVLGGLTALVCAAIGCFISITEYNRVDYDFQRFACLLRENGNQRLVGTVFKGRADSSRCGYFSSFDNYNSVEWATVGERIVRNGELLIATPHSARVEMAAVIILWTIAMAVASFAAVFTVLWLVGWVFAGFSRA